MNGVCTLNTHSYACLSVFFFGKFFVFKNTNNQRLILDAAPASLPTRIIGLFPVVFLNDFKTRRFHKPTGYMLALILMRCATGFTLLIFHQMRYRMIRLIWIR